MELEERKEEKVEEGNKQFVVFKLKEEEFGIDIYRVREVLKLLPITAIPHSDLYIEGVINIRGSIVPVVDLCQRFDLQEDSRNNDTRIIIVEMNGDQLGLIVDEVSEVLRVSIENIQPPPSGAQGVDNNLLEGVARCEDRLIILLKVENLLTSSEKVAFQDIKEEASKVEEAAVS